METVEREFISKVRYSQGAKAVAINARPVPTSVREALDELYLGTQIQQSVAVVLDAILSSRRRVSGLSISVLNGLIEESERVQEKFKVRSGKVYQGTLAELDKQGGFVRFIRGADHQAVQLMVVVHPYLQQHTDPPCESDAWLLIKGACIDPDESERLKNTLTQSYSDADIQALSSSGTSGSQ